MLDYIYKYLNLSSTFQNAHQRAKLDYEKPIQNSEAAYMCAETTKSQNNFITDPKTQMKLIQNIVWQWTFISSSGSQVFKK